MSRPRNPEGAPAREIAEEAIHLLRAAPIAAWGAYYLGAAPFCAVLVYFLNTMAISASAENDLPALALLLAVLFGWMKAWQARFAAELQAVIHGEAAPPGGMAAFWRALCRQVPLQATGLIALPLALASVILYIPVYSFYQSLTALDGRQDLDTRGLATAAGTEAARWQKQAFVLSWMFSPMLMLISTGMAWLSPAVVHLYGTAPGVFWGFWTGLLGLFNYAFSPVCTVVWLNLAGATMFAGTLLKSYLDIDTVFAWAPGAAMNQGLLAGIAAATYLAIDPVIKAAYVVRCHRGVSLGTGEDLRAALRRVLATGTVALALLFAVPALAADTAPLDQALSSSLDQALDEELAKPVYAWRESYLDASEKGWLRRQVDRLSQWTEEKWDAFVQRMREAERNSDSAGSGDAFDWFSLDGGLLSLLGYGLLVVLLGIVLYIAAKVATQQWKFYHQESAQLESAVISAPVELTDEGARADALPEDGWLKMANELYARGEIRLAMRALFLATLSVLAERQFISIVRHKSNTEYLREVRQRGGGPLWQTVSEGAGLYEGVWYGEHPATPEGYAAMRQSHEQVSGR